ncbi:hypothetical protein TNCV_3900101, partial [Trichonephila clavipes]
MRERSRECADRGNVQHHLCWGTSGHDGQYEVWFYLVQRGRFLCLD